MKRVISALLAAAAVVTVAVPASARDFAPRGWSPIAQREANLDQRIDAGARRGDLTREEARRLRFELRELVRLENRYSRDGLNAWERRDLDARFDRLSAKVRYERHDRQTRRW